MSESIIIGRNSVREALEKADGRIEKVLIQQGAHGSQIDAIRRAAKSVGAPMQMVPEVRLNKLAPKSNHQGVVAMAAPVAYADCDAMLGHIGPDLDAVRERKPILLAMDGIEDPHNFGAILRSVAASGASGVIVPDWGQAPLSATAVKASAGTALTVPIARVSNLADTLHGLKERGYWVIGLDGGPTEGKQERATVWEYDWDRPVALVVGGEGSGIRPRVRAQCDALVSIPMSGDVESLNASVAAGIALFAAAAGRT